MPILRTAEAEVAVRWYGRLGFEEEWTHRFGDGMPAFVSVRRGTPGTGVRIFLSETPECKCLNAVGLTSRDLLRDA